MFRFWQKTRLMSLFGLLTAVFLLTAFAPASAAEQTPDQPDCPICDFDMSTYDGPLTAVEVNGLLLALNDEYHAWAIYDQVIQDFGAVRPFTNIKRSEAQHIASLEALFVTYDVPIPANPWPGDVPSFTSTTAACQAGVDAELLNRDLYTQLYQTTGRTDIIWVYERLQAASENNHLRAFQRCAGR